ncbi:MAG: hypothetical protein ACOYIQ_01475 [Christensenellales bacterium]|jgi:stage III sporulation protein AG
MQAKAISAKAKEFWEKAKTIKNIEIIIAVIAIGIVLLIYASTLSSNKIKNTSLPSANQIAGEGEEERLAAILSQIEGAGRVSVMITYEKNDYAAEASAEAGEPKIKGVIIVAEGAQDVAVRLNLIRAAQTVLDIKSDTIEVFVMKK